ncbi:MAG: ANL family adenylate-forming protein [Candidatus Acidiferrales bacterium]
MSAAGFLLEKFDQRSAETAVIWHEQSYDYHWLLGRFEHWRGVLKNEHIHPGQVVIFEAEFSPNSVALLLALIECGCVVVPLTKSVRDKKAEFIDIARGEIMLFVDEHDLASIERLSGKGDHEVYDRLREMSHPGLVLFSSGSTGKSKAAVHDFTAILEKFSVPRKAYRTIAFLLFDHIGGVNTLFYTLSNGGTLIVCEERSPDAVLTAIERFRAELLPTSPTFINLILLSEAYRRHDLSSLKLVTYGTEAMPENTLKRFHSLFPQIQLAQTYGLSEVGILRAKSKSSDSLWVKIGGEGFETRIVDGALQIKAKSAMLGYLNAPSPFTDDGWFITGDSVEVDGEYLKILGRKSELINVGGEKVYPCEVESIIQEFENVAEVSVYGEKNPLVGHIVCARVRLKQEDPSGDFAGRLKAFCRSRMQSYKVPVKVLLTSHSQYSERYKKMRREP